MMTSWHGNTGHLWWESSAECWILHINSNIDILFDVSLSNVVNNQYSCRCFETQRRHIWRKPRCASSPKRKTLLDYTTSCNTEEFTFPTTFRQVLIRSRVPHLKLKIRPQLEVTWYFAGSRHSVWIMPDQRNRILTLNWLNCFKDYKRYILISKCILHLAGHQVFLY